MYACVHLLCRIFFFFSSRRRHTRCSRDWSSDVCSSDLGYLRTVGTVWGLGAGVSVRGSLNVVPSSLEAVYGSRTPAGLAIYIRLRPAGPRESGMMMPGMPGDRKSVV